MGSMQKLALFLIASSAVFAQNYQPTWDSIDKRPTPAWFQDAKFGIFIHWGVYSVPAYAPVIPGKLAYAEWIWNAMTNGQKPSGNAIQTGTWEYHKKMYGADYPYQNFAPQFRAELFDPDHWADVFQRSGAKYVALTSKHHEGFALWPSKEASATWGRPWNAVEIGPKRDVLGRSHRSRAPQGAQDGLLLFVL
ncbi:MAG: alpha-L-fucosidase [Paludibaculum sp.]